MTIKKERELLPLFCHLLCTTIPHRLWNSESRVAGGNQRIQEEKKVSRRASTALQANKHTTVLFSTFQSIFRLPFDLFVVSRDDDAKMCCCKSRIKSSFPCGTDAHTNFQLVENPDTTAQFVLLSRLAFPLMSALFCCFFRQKNNIRFSHWWTSSQQVRSHESSLPWCATHDDVST